MDLDKLLEIGDRCINEAPPACTAYCPLHLDVKSFTEEIESGNFNKAYKLMEKRIPFTRIIGMICDHPCEDLCVRDKKGGVISIGELEKSVVYHGYTKPKKGFKIPSINKKVAVIGSGLQGLTASYDLLKKGIGVDIYEKNDRVGGRIWSFQGEYITSELISEELEFLNDKNATIFLNTLIDENKLKDLISQYDAVFIAANNLMSLYEIDTDTFQVESSNVFVGKMEEALNNSIIFSVSVGRRSAISIERYIKGTSMTASRENEGSYKTALNYKTDDEETIERKIKSGHILTRDEAIEEATRCFKCQCRDCIKECVHLKRFDIAPKSYIRNINHNERIIKGSHYANKMILSCTECGLCDKMCDYDVDMKEVIIETRKSMVEREKMPQSAHDFALKDMKFSNSEKFFTYRKEPEKENIKYVLYPGCQLPASNPDYIENIYKYLTDSIDEGVGLMLGCCGAPADWAGQAELMEENASLIKNAWTEMGKPTFILACSSCMSNFEKYMDEINYVSLWEIIDEHELPKNTISSQTLKLNIHDPCTARDHSRMQESIRNIVSKLNNEVHELRYSKELTKCCGYGGLVYFANRDQSNDFIDDRIMESSEDLLVYCTMCKDLFTSRGKRTFHILDLLFSDDFEKSALQKMPTLSERQYNRMYVKKKLLKDIWGEEIMYDEGKYNITFTEQAQDKMEEMYIVFSDVRKSVENSIEKRERFYDPSNQSYLTRLRIENVTYWVQYEMKEKDVVVTNVYSHRMEVVEVNSNEGS
ncbi:cysteine-rich protein [Alkalibaculum bacchi]|uniref:Cysteine-rich protein n=1 Tax=Alkalibaculum bacchi TaxID=645887 RepID=A0A366I905_9FIRM|nr:pyridine nucleotide-disulfide oxidoreductase/dicluster-binding protein [Alkalibaculum bacchi]RBP66017.1 cysteine-rich protein [Alkalibaculum bacchi]